MAAALALFHTYRKFLTLLVVLAGAASLYFWMEKAKDDRDLLLTQAREICATAGEPFQPEGSKQKDWGKRCNGRVAALVEFRDKAQVGSIDAMLADIERREGKQAADAALAAVYAKRATDALTRMEAADAAVKDDRVGGDWAAAVNDLAGLR
ncbi:hypothetical protein SH203_02830 [Brevundimonas sp. SH203]|uniref:hypothetical protein n=1 Tax=Brevundimonas sp. SH203 TaxID=345167 RepID=UPI0009CE3C8D|nr:hypothetical protein [Brevundimonas sp. SH203]GAW42414.1 hypothetical protein SH203_02830 [Brevundimonas sp. SH203]